MLALFHQTENLRAKLGLVRADTGLEIELVYVQRTDHHVALDPALNELSTLVRTDILNCAQTSISFENGNFFAASAEQFCAAL